MPLINCKKKQYQFVGEEMQKNVIRMIRYGICLLSVAALAMLAGCGSEKNDPMEKIKDLEFTVLADDNIPQELKVVIEEKKQDPFKVTYQDNGFMYICVGYGEQVSGGYSIAVNALYLTENAIYMDTTLLGPDPSDPAAGKKNSVSCPYIVLKTEFIDKPVVFN